MEDAPAPATADLPPPRYPPTGRKIWRRLARWTGELITVFIGVYTAFALNSYQAHRQERQRREQILAWAQAEYTETLAFADDEGRRLREAAEIFNRRVKAGEMPALHAFNFRTDYNPADFTSMLQSGGFDLLDIQTVRAIREVEGSLRQIIEVIRHNQQLSDALILPNLDQAPGYFYDPTSRQLRPGYAFYPEYFNTESELFAEMRPEVVKVLTQIRIERERNR